MEDNKKLGLYNVQDDTEEKSSFDFKAIYKAVLLNWKYFFLSIIICLGLGAIYLRYATPTYQAYAKLLIKDDDNSSSGYRSARNSIMATQDLGIISNSAGIDNEMEILSSVSLSMQTIRDLKLYVTYRKKGRVKDVLLYKVQPISVDIDSAHLERLEMPITLDIERKGNNYDVTGKYSYVSSEDGTVTSYGISKTISRFPAQINTRVGTLLFNNNIAKPMDDGAVMKVTIVSPKMAAPAYVNALSVSQTSKTTSIAKIVINDESPQRAIDYLNQLAICYNRQANDDKNEIARKTEAFINGRLEKINAELGDTEGKLESFKKSNSIVGLDINSAQAAQNQDTYSQKLAEANLQLELLRSVGEYMNDPSNQYQPLPSDVGLTDKSATALINRYNDIVMERNRLLKSASESSPTVMPLTAQLDELSNSIRRAMSQARRNMELQRSNVAQQYGKYQGQVSSNPEQERMLTQIGRQQDVKSGLYLMLLQKREENSISLAATADKGRLIDQPQYSGKVSPKASMVMLIALVLGIALPAGVIYLVNFFRFRIEGHEDVEQLTSLPIIADVAVASDAAKTKADIVVHENQNNQMEEIFRSMRTNLQFMMKNGQNVIMFTSCSSGEGKTFTAANLAVSFALLDKKAVLVGLDIRKPRLAELFEIDDHHHGITSLLTIDNPTDEDVKKQIVPSGVNANLDLLMAGPVPPNPTELIARESLDKIVSILRKDYDYVLIDTAPVGLVSDTLQIGRVADITVYVCRADYTPKSSFEIVNALNKENKLPNMCIVINGIDMSKKKYGYYYGYGKYGKYGRYGSYYGYGHNYGKYGDSRYSNIDDGSVKQ